MGCTWTLKSQGTFLVTNISGPQGRAKMMMRKIYLNLTFSYLFILILFWSKDLWRKLYEDLCFNIHMYKFFFDKQKLLVDNLWK